MAKFDFENSRYAQLFLNSEINFLAKFIDETDLFRRNDAWWKTQFEKDGGITPTDMNGKAAFTVKAINSKAAPMMDMRAPLGDSIPVDNEGIAFYTGTIPDFIAPGIVENATEREYRERVYATFGNDADIVMAWSKKVLNQFSSANQTLSNLGAQLISTGKMTYNFGRGIQSSLHKAEIPAENFLKAGAKVWSAADCDILAQMAKIEQDFREAKGYDGPMVWQVTRNKFFNQILKNQSVIEWIKSYRTLQKEPWVDSMPVTEEMFRTAIAGYPGISPIEIVVEKQKNLTWEGTTDVHGWDDKIAVLRPAGYAGVIKYTNILDQLMHEKYGASTIVKVFSQLEGGIMTLANTTLNNGDYKEWHTDLFMSAVPALTEFPYHLIVDTSLAD